MTTRSVTQAKAELSALLRQVELGEEVIITRNGRPLAKLVKFESSSAPRKLGALAGQIWTSPDFDQFDHELAEWMYQTPIEPGSNSLR